MDRSNAALLDRLFTERRIAVERGELFATAPPALPQDLAWDNDTIAAIVGTVAGALHGKCRLPARWLDGLLGRTAEADDGRVFELIAAARTLWWET
jgi:hypothetical protein